MNDCRKCSIVARSAIVAIIGVIGLAMFLAGVINVGKTGTKTVAEYDTHEHYAMLGLAGGLIMVISLLLPFFCVTECGDGVQKKFGIRKDYDLL